MPRKRMIDPGIWDDPAFGSLTDSQRILWIALISLANDEGIVCCDLRYICSCVWKFRPHMPLKTVEKSLCAIKFTMPNSIYFFKYNGIEYAYLTRWTRYQYINKPKKSPVPIPEGVPDVVPEQVRDEVPDTLPPKTKQNKTIVRDGTPYRKYEPPKIRKQTEEEKGKIRQDIQGIISQLKSEEEEPSQANEPTKQEEDDLI